MSTDRTEWPVVPLDNVASDIRLLRTRLRLLEIETKEKYCALDERMDALEREMDELVGD